MQITNIDNEITEETARVSTASSEWDSSSNASSEYIRSDELNSHQIKELIWLSFYGQNAKRSQSNRASRALCDSLLIKIKDSNHADANKMREALLLVSKKGTGSVSFTSREFNTLDKFFQTSLVNPSDFKQLKQDFFKPEKLSIADLGLLFATICIIGVALVTAVLAVTTGILVLVAPIAIIFTLFVIGSVMKCITKAKDKIIKLKNSSSRVETNPELELNSSQPKAKNEKPKTKDEDIAVFFVPNSRKSNQDTFDNIVCYEPAGITENPSLTTLRDSQSPYRIVARSSIEVDTTSNANHHAVSTKTVSTKAKKYIINDTEPSNINIRCVTTGIGMAPKKDTGHAATINVKSTNNSVGR